MNSFAGRLSVIVAVTLALFGCGDRPSSPTAVIETRTAVIETPTAEGDGSVSAQVAESKVTICHIPPGNPANAHTITVGASAVPAHLANHGDSIGPCPVPSPSPSPTPTPGA